MRVYLATGELTGFLLVLFYLVVSINRQVQQSQKDNGKANKAITSEEEHMDQTT